MIAPGAGAGSDGSRRIYTWPPRFRRRVIVLDPRTGSRNPASSPRTSPTGFVKLTGFTPKSRFIIGGCSTQFQWLSLMEKCRKQPTIS